MPEQQPGRDRSQERRAGQQLEQRERVGLAARARHRDEHRDRQARTLSRPDHPGQPRAAWRASAGTSRPTATAVASASRTDQSPASSPGDQGDRRPSATRRAPAPAGSRMVRVKNPRLTSFHSGTHHRNASEPATASASTSAMYPAAPVTCSHPAYGSTAYPAPWARRSLAATPGRLAGHMDDWRTYDDVAETYERVHASRFAEVAATWSRWPGSAKAPRSSTSAPGPGSPPRRPPTVGRPRRRHRRVDGHAARGPPSASRRVPWRRPQAIDLPFRERVVRRRDRQLRAGALHKYETALFDIDARAEASEARVGFSSWSDGVDAYQTAWSELVESVVPREMLAPAYAEAGAVARASSASATRSRRR